MKLDVQFSEQNENMNVRMGEFWGGGGTTDHTKLTNRDAADQHPIGAISGLGKSLYGKKLVEVPVGVETYKGFIETDGRVVKSEGATDICCEIQTENLPSEFYLEAGKKGNDALGWYTILDENDTVLEFSTASRVDSEVEQAQRVTKITLPEGAKRLVVAYPTPRIWATKDTDFPEAYSKDGVFWSRVWRYDREESDPEDDEGMRYQTEHTYGLYYWLWKNNVPVKLVGYNGKPDENGSMYGVYDMTGWETSTGVSNGKKSGTITFLRLDVKPYTLDSYRTLVHIGTQLDLIAVTAWNGTSITTHKRVYIPEIPSADLYNGANIAGYTGDVVPAFEIDGTGGAAYPKLLVGNKDFFRLSETYSADAIKSAVDNSMVFSDKQAIVEYQDNAIAILSRANEVKPKNLINPDSPDVRYGWYFYNTSTARLTGQGTALWATTGYIKVKPNTPYFLYGNATPRAFDKDKVFVRKSWTNLYGTSSSTNGRFYTFADGIEYVRFSAKTGVTDSADNETFFRNNFVMYEFDGELYDFTSGSERAVKYLPNNPIWKPSTFRMSRI